MERITLYEEFRFIERTEAEVNAIWKGGHLLLFFLAFVFGSFCTFCFHLLMYLFDEKCVLFPKLLSLSSLRQNIIYELVPEDKDAADMLPVDFVSTQWVEKSACLLPTYVPLVSGIFGLVWTTMFLMCSTGSRVLTGLQRPWRVLPPVFLFSLAMGSLCVYTSAVTHYGLQELCLKLSEITGSATCTYTINVATLAYERRIRGVYQATRLTIYSAWLHTACWLLSALLALARVVLAIDFKLVRVRVQLQGNIDRMLERHEQHIRTISPDALESRRPSSSTRYSSSAVRIHFKKKEFRANYDSLKDLSTGIPTRNESEEEGDLLYYSDLTADRSEQSLLPSEKIRLGQLKAISNVAVEHQFIVKMLYNVLDAVDSKSTQMMSSESLIESEKKSETTIPITRQYGHPRILSNLSQVLPEQSKEKTTEEREETLETVKEIKKYILDRINENIIREKLLPYISNKKEFESTLYVASDFKLLLKDEPVGEPGGTPTGLSEPTGPATPTAAEEEPEPSTSKGAKGPGLKSNLKRVGVQTDDTTKEKPLTVQIDSKTSVFSSKTSKGSLDIVKTDKQTQTKKDKQE